LSHPTISKEYINKYKHALSWWIHGVHYFC
jgi:hypothetical protein